VVTDLEISGGAVIEWWPWHCLSEWLVNGQCSGAYGLQQRLLGLSGRLGAYQSWGDGYQRGACTTGEHCHMGHVAGQLHCI
jgi:hypothetical protein